MEEVDFSHLDTRDFNDFHPLSYPLASRGGCSRGWHERGKESWWCACGGETCDRRYWPTKVSFVPRGVLLTFFDPPFQRFNTTTIFWVARALNSQEFRASGKVNPKKDNFLKSFISALLSAFFFYYATQWVFPLKLNHKIPQIPP